MTSALRADGRAARLAVLEAHVSLSRGERFLRRRGGKAAVGFAALQAMPEWTGLPAGQHDRLALVAGMLLHRATIDRELTGERLRPLADQIGHAVFDAACAIEVDNGDPAEVLPAIEQMRSEGRALLAASLPHAIRPVDAACHPRARELASIAARLLRASAA